MARAKKSTAGAGKSAPAKSPKRAAVDEGALTKGQIRKRNALRKSLGQDIADKAFAEWLKSNAGTTASEVDKNAALIADSLGPLAQAGKLRIPRGGYLVSRGRKRVIVERMKTK